MAIFSVSSVALNGIAVCVPKRKSCYESTFSELFTPKEYRQFQLATGVESRRIASAGFTTSDYAFEAAKKLCADMQINPKDIDLLVFVSQSPDYILPMTSCILQEKLGLSKHCITFDIASGCSGYIQGLSVVASMLSSGQCRQALLLAGDVAKHQISESDKTTYPLFGAAASATLLSYDKNALPIYFEMGTDGSGSDAICIPDGGGRNPYSAQSLIQHNVAKGVVRTNTHLVLNGEDVFSFAISEVPDSIERLYSHYGLTLAATDYFVFHQANKLILDTIADIMELPFQKIPMSLQDFGNTSSASIPLTIATQIGTIQRPTTLCLVGFGVGLCWGSVYLCAKNLFCSPLLEV